MLKNVLINVEIQKEDYAVSLRPQTPCRESKMRKLKNSRDTPPRQFDSAMKKTATTNQKRFDPSTDETTAKRLGGQNPMMSETQISARYVTQTCGKAPRRSPRSRADRGEPDSCGAHAAVPRPVLIRRPDHAGATVPAGPTLTPTAPALCAAALRRSHAAWQIGQRRFGGLAARAAMRWLEGTGLRRAAHAPARKGCDAPSGPATARSAARPQGRIGPG